MNSLKVWNIFGSPFYTAAKQMVNSQPRVLYHSSTAASARSQALYNHVTSEICGGPSPNIMNNMTKLSFLSKPFARTFSSAQMMSPTPLARQTWSSWRVVLGTLVGVTAGAHLLLGSESDFYEYRFLVNKDADDLASFYGGEEFMELFCVFPFVGTLMMRNGTFDEKGTIHTMGIPGGDLQVSMVFSDDVDSDGQTEWFNKRERFKNVVAEKYKMWDMVTNFGFHRLDDGRIECYHHGEYFMANLPLISPLIKLVFMVHARWVAWATEHHLNHHAFTSQTEEEEAIEELSRTNVAWYMLKHHVWKDTKAMIFGVHSAPADETTVAGNGIAPTATEEVDTPQNVSFLVKDSQDTNGRTLSIKRRKTFNQIQRDIEIDQTMPQSEIVIDDENLGAYSKLTMSAKHRHDSLRPMKRRSRKPTKTLE